MVQVPIAAGVGSLSEMTEAPRRYIAATRAALAVLSRGTCYFPGCEYPLIRFIDGEPFIDFQIAHIRDARPGDRYDKSMSDDERRAFGNLILLCKPHHTLVDKTHPERYTSNDLQQWKHEREDAGVGALEGDSEINDSTIEEALTSVAITIAGDVGVFQVGGQGGSAPGAGGGGGGVIGSGSGGPGGPGGSMVIADDARIEIHGTHATDPGSGGGGGGAVAPGSIRRPLEAITAVLGSGYSEGTDGGPGGDTWISDDKGNILVHAAGGKAGLSGTGVRSSTDQLGVSVLMIVEYVRAQEGLVNIIGGGWSWISVLNLNDSLNIAVLITFEAGNTEPGEYTAAIEVYGPDDQRKTVLEFPVTVVTKGDVVRIQRICSVPITVDAFGKWRITVVSLDRKLASLDMIIKRTGEA